MAQYEVAIVGGGPAGLQCALLLGRARRSVILIDRGEPRNADVIETHGFLTRDGATPADLFACAREQLRRYPNVAFQTSEAQSARPSESDSFELEIQNGERIVASRVLIATGMRDRLPEIPELRECWGKSAFVCPYCDGWEVRDAPIAVWGNTRSGTSLARELYQWSRDILVCSGLTTPITPDEREWLDANGVRVKEGSIARLHHDAGGLQAIEFDDGERVPRRALFLSVMLEQCCDLAEAMGCHLTTRGHIDVDHEYRTSVPGVYAAGDCVTHMHQIVFAAASGARAAIAINDDLTNEAAELAMKRE